MTLFLVRHGRPVVDRTRPAHEWELDQGGYDDVWALRSSGRLPSRAAWFSSPEPKAVATAGLLTDGEVGVVDELCEHRRATTRGSRTSTTRCAGLSRRPTRSRWPAGSL